MSEATNSLHRTMSVRTLPRNDGHKEGHLNIIATRHGWTRTLSIGPEEVHALDYATLEAVLELNTLRLRPQHLRLFVESPPNSGQFCKIRYWKDDDSLQSVLVKQFFNQRMEEGTLTSIDIRDGHDRDDAISVKSGISGSRLLPGSLSRPGETKEWLRRRGLNRSNSLRSGHPDDEDAEHHHSTPQASRTQALMYFLGFTSEPPRPPPKTNDQIASEARQEEEALRKHGWMPPVLRRITSRRSQKSTQSGKTRIIASNPFFSSSERNLIRRKKSSKDPDVPEEADEHNEELQMIDSGEASGAQPKPKDIQKETRWLRFFSAKNEEPNPFLGTKEKGKGKQRPKVEIVGKPTDAFDHSPNASE